ncbi:MAG: hypothetical protein with 50bp hit to Dihydrolipoamide acetyltransferase [uncultured Thiotrichaceae bacterium]|uniref:Uncharacterized protein n=1 Tax=uncultured Thiotrichaceae bacterium TaxID=298394 RepID=A0A6S6THT7_9GAMM|nr:MAG: hypothetical protein with 50bp hit to Dihydrolipoamide acetyltransferase [uncultured Thiotrichaceae bacterium]
MSHSREAKMNMKTLMEKLRPFWEGNAEALAELESGVITLNVTDTNGQVHASFELDIVVNDLQVLLEDRIRKGVVSFFDALRESFSNSAISMQDVEKINIFLAGNSSKSALVSKVFDEEIKLRSEAIKKALHFTDEQSIFELHQTLGNNEDAIDKPTGKTGVAFGLIETRKGGKTLVIDHNTDENNINFKYYLGMNKRNKFRTLIDRSDEYNQWTDFIDAGEDTFEVYYASLASASTNQLDISDPSIQKKMLRIDTVDEDASVFIRLKNATEFEYVVATEESLQNNQYLDNVKAVAL